MSRPWLVQASGTDCQLYALVNTMRFYGCRTPKPGSNEWEGLVDAIGARHGSAISMNRAELEVDGIRVLHQCRG